MTSAILPRTTPITANELLTALAGDERERIAPHLSRVELKPGEILYEAGRPQHWVYFPCGAVVSILHVIENGSSIEIAMVGSEGMIGVAHLLSGAAALDRAVVQCAGAAARMRVDAVREEFRRGGSMQQVLLRHLQALMAQTAQVAVCNRYHTVDQQLCRWLLMSLDRLPSNDVTATQEVIGQKIGVRRESVAAAALALQRAGAIEYKHGHLRVTNRPQLEAKACECYKVANAELARLLPWSSLCDVGGRADGDALDRGDLPGARWPLETNGSGTNRFRPDS